MMSTRERLLGSIRRARALRPGTQTSPAVEVSERTLHDALIYLAQIVTEHGQQYAPLFDMIEDELEKYKRARDPVSRARQVLAENAVDVSPKSLPSAQS